jgi:RNA polymerase sigma-70 factor (ECF subfamily)
MADQDEDVLRVARCLRGDASAFDAIVKRYQRVLFSVAHRMLGNYEDALDATQNAFVRAYEGLESYDPDRRFFSWIYRIAVNECLNLKRARRPIEPLPDEMEAAAADGPLETVAAHERSEWIDAALGRLSEPHCRLVVHGNERRPGRAGKDREIAFIRGAPAPWRTSSSGAGRH